VSRDQLQELVNAQVEVNRAVALANAQGYPEIYKHYVAEDVSDVAIKEHITNAIEHLKKVSDGLPWKGPFYQPPGDRV